MNTTHRLLGIDYGSKRIGLALTDSTNTFAIPHSVVENSAAALDDILKICEANGVGKIVIGESHDFAGQPNPIQADIEKFIERVKARTVLDIVSHPEFLTSAEAVQVQGKNAMLDASAAAIILQSYIDTHDQHRRF